MPIGVIVTSGCFNCLLHETGEEEFCGRFSYCRLIRRNALKWSGKEGRSPKWCPLRKRAVVIALEGAKTKGKEETVVP